MGDKKQEIIQFIANGMDDDAFERMQDLNEENGFRNLEHFIEHNRQCVINLKVKDVNTIYNLCQMIKSRCVALCDEESFVEFTADRIYFNIKRQLVIGNPR